MSRATKRAPRGTPTNALPLARSLVIAFLLVLVAVASPALLTDLGQPNRVFWLMAAVPPVIAGSAFLVMGRRAWASPPVIMNAIVYVSTVGIYLLNPGAEGFWGTGVVSEFAPFAVLPAVAFALGSLASFSGSRPKYVGKNANVDWVAIHRIARVALVGSIAFGLWLLPNTDVTQRGVDQLNRGLLDSLGVGVTVVTTLSIALLLSGKRRLVLARKADLLLIVLPGILDAASGNRGALTTSVVMLLGASALRGRLRLWHVLVGGLTLFGFGRLVVLYRAQEEFTNIFDAREFLDTSVGSVYGSLSLTMANVPGLFPFAQGSTYIEAVRFLLPGSIARQFFGDPQTGTFVFREIIDLDNPNVGLAYALPSEAYLNFGVVGLVFIPAGVALSLVWLWRRTDLSQLSYATQLYLVVFGSFVVLWRSDALGQLKTLTYSAALIFLLKIYADRRHRPQDVSHRSHAAVAESSPTINVGGSK